jgi:hypothetical protein
MIGLGGKHKRTEAQMRTSIGLSKFVFALKIKGEREDLGNK